MQNVCKPAMDFRQWPWRRTAIGDWMKKIGDLVRLVLRAKASFDFSCTSNNQELPLSKKSCCRIFQAINVKCSNWQMFLVSSASMLPFLEILTNKDISQATFFLPFLFFSKFKVPSACDINFSSNLPIHVKTLLPFQPSLTFSFFSHKLKQVSSKNGSWGTKPYPWGRQEALCWRSSTGNDHVLVKVSPSKMLLL